jgi:uncharacterized protein (TIGR02217 family)
MSFAEIRLDLGIDYGTRGGPRFSTSIIVDGSGAEQRNANWGQPLGRWQLGERSLTQLEIHYFLDFHTARKGATEGFRFKDWTDYQAKFQPIGTGDGNKTQFQLVKNYTIAAYSAIRPILKPVGGTVKIYLNGVKQASGWSIDITTGVVTFAAAPGAGVALTADFEFDVPVRFEQDKIEFRFDAYEVGTGLAIFHLDNLSLVEDRLAPTIRVAPLAVPSRIDHVLDLGYDYGTLGGPAYNTTITTVGSGYERRTSNWDNSRGRWQIGDRTLTRAELDYLIAFYRVVRGTAAGFGFKNWQQEINVPVRFEQDSIEFRFDAHDPGTGEAIFYLAGLSVAETLDGVSALYGASCNNYVLTITTDRPSYCGAHLNPYTLIHDSNISAHGSGPGPDGLPDDVVISLSNPSLCANHFPGFTVPNTFFRTKSSYYTDIQCPQPNYTITESWELTT